MNLIYPQHSGGFPSGLFAHYSYSAAFCLGTIGLLLSRCHKEAAWLKMVFIGGAVCALVTIPLSLSRGANLALVAMVALIFIPVILCFWRFVNRADATHTSWAAIGLLAMLFQSNFESILHAAPGAFVAALILGQISRGLWGAETPQALETADADLNFLSAVNAHVAEYAADDPEALPKLVSLLSQSKSEPWRRGSYRLRYWAKVHDSAALSKAVKGLGVQSSEELARLSSGQKSLVEQHFGTRALGNFALAGCALPIVLAGTTLSQALIRAWLPLYHPQQLSVANRFSQLLSLVERTPGLGIDRKVLSAARDCIYQFKSQEAREYWATTYRLRMVRAIPSWRTDPGAALQLAEITGWAGVKKIQPPPRGRGRLWDE